MNRLLTAARYYVDCCDGSWGMNGDPDKARKELIDAARDAYLASLAIQRHTPFHDAAHSLVSASVAQMDMCDQHGHARIPEPCHCVGGICAGVTADGLTTDYRRCKAPTQEKL